MFLFLSSIGVVSRLVAALSFSSVSFSLLCSRGGGGGGGGILFCGAAREAIDSEARHGSCRRAHVHKKATAAVRFMLAREKGLGVSLLFPTRCLTGKPADSAHKPQNLLSNNTTGCYKRCKCQVVMEFRVALSAKRQDILLLQLT